MVKDLGSTSFGLLIAYILPGMAALYGLAVWIGPVQSLFEGFLTAESTMGLSLVVVLVSIALGLHITVLRELLFEKLICRSSKRCSEDLSELGRDGKLVAFRAAVDENYRYHQFWGGMFVALPLTYTGLLHQNPPATNQPTLLTFLAIWILSLYAAMVSFRRYIATTNRILRGSSNAERMEGSPTAAVPAGGGTEGHTSAAATGAGATTPARATEPAETPATA